MATIDKRQVNEIFPALTAREADVVQRLLEGDAMKRIAYDLGLADQTVKNHVYNIYRKLNINSKGELFRLTLEYVLTSWVPVR